MSNRKRAEKAQPQLRKGGRATPAAVERVMEHGGNLGCATERLRHAVDHEGLAAQEMEDAVLHARLVHGFTWDQVADELGISRQAVQKRYAVAEQLAAEQL